ncbi:helix-turn-helix domain-containing protein [Brevibacterium oceani]|uniref:helix-turn-helix domain-containing protein n=1 Tax=Brevibacterium oceani TaxID=358099 RepID=UPI0015E7B57E|nr:helix-turn-helix transcriptional regulator [Brevibacterium oceani]
MNSRIRERAKANALQGLHLRSALRYQRNRLGLSEAELAERMGVSEKFVHEFERYDSNPTLRDIQRYATGVESLIELNITPGKEDE